MCLPTILCTRWALPCSLPCTPCCLCSETCAGFTGDERPGLPAAGFCCGSSVPCSHEKGSWVRGRLYCASPVALARFMAKKNTPSLEINFCLLKSHCLHSLERGSLYEQLEDQELCWAGAGGGDVKGRGLQPPTYQGRMSKNRTWKHAWGGKKNIILPSLSWNGILWDQVTEPINNLLVTKIDCLGYAMPYYATYSFSSQHRTFTAALLLIY